MASVGVFHLLAHISKNSVAITLRACWLICHFNSLIIIKEYESKWKQWVVSSPRLDRCPGYRCILCCMLRSSYVSALHGVHSFQHENFSAISTFGYSVHCVTGALSCQHNSKLYIWALNNVNAMKHHSGGEHLFIVVVDLFACVCVCVLPCI